MVNALRRLFGQTKAVDPVCGMEVDPKQAPGGSFEHEGKTYHFCSPGCRMEFQEDPEGYLSGRKKMEM
jgi:P-type Cu+ transporter